MPPKRKNNKSQLRQQVKKQKQKYEQKVKISLTDDILENILKYSMLMVEEGFKISAPSCAIFSFGNESYSFDCISSDPIFCKYFVRNINHLFKLSLVNKYFYYYLLINMFSLKISYDKNDFLYKNNSKIYNIYIKRLFFIPEWISLYLHNDIMKRQQFQISEDQLIYITTYYEKYRLMILEETGMDGYLTDLSIKEFIIPKFLLHKSFYSLNNNYLLKDINIYKSNHFLIKIRRRVELNLITIISLKDNQVVREIDGKGKIMRRCFLFCDLPIKKNIRDNYYFYYKKPFMFHFFNNIVLDIIMKLSDIEIMELLL
jgi:hypothetical protein